MTVRHKASSQDTSSATIRFEANLWLGDISIYCQESNVTPPRLEVVNLTIRGIEAHFGPKTAEPFRRDFHPDPRQLRAGQWQRVLQPLDE